MCYLGMPSFNTYRDWHMPAGNNKSIRDWPINSLVGYASQEYAKNHAIRE
jgi:hypothetical protein